MVTAFYSRALNSNYIYQCWHTFHDGCNLFCSASLCRSDSSTIIHWYVVFIEHIDPRIRKHIQQISSFGYIVYLIGKEVSFLYVCETLLGHQTNTLCRSTFYWKCLSSFFTVKVLYSRWDIISMPIFAINIVTLLCHLVYVISNMFTKFTQYKLMASHVCCWRNWLVPS